MMKSIFITIKVTDSCNMRCKHCYHAEMGFNGDIINIELIKKLLKIASKEYNKIEILYMGGEPTLFGLANYEEVISFQKYLSDTKHITFTNKIQTNGLLLNDEWINFFIKNNFNVGISYDGPHNNDFREQSEIVLNNILNSKKQNMNFGILCVENNDSIKTLDKTYEWFKEKGLNFKILPLFLAGNAKKNNLLELEASEYANKIIDVYKIWLFDCECNIDVATFHSFLQMTDKMECIHRGAGCLLNRIAITYNGDMYPCGRPYTNDFKLGHINSFNSIQDMFRTDGYLKLLSINNKRLQSCKNCQVFSACKGGCISDSILEKSFSKINNPTCIKTKKLLQLLKLTNQEIYQNFDSISSKLNKKAIEIIKSTK